MEIINATATSSEISRFWVDGVGAEEVGFNRFLVGDSLVRCIHIAETIAPTVRSAAGFRYLTVQVMDVDREYARLLELGFTGERRPVSLGTTARISFVRDPDGGYLEVSQRAEFTGDSIPEEGNTRLNQPVCMVERLPPASARRDFDAVRRTVSQCSDKITDDRRSGRTPVE